MSQQKKHFFMKDPSRWNNSDSNNSKKGTQSQSVLYIYIIHITGLGRTDF